MNKYPGIPELLEQYMGERGTGDLWITVHELRDRFGLTRYQCNTVSGFLRRLEYGPFGQCPYIVARIETAGRGGHSDPPRCRYLVKPRNSRHAAVPGTVHAGMTGRRKVDIC